MSDRQVITTENHENGLIATVRCKEMDFAACEALKEAVARAVAARPCPRCVIHMSVVEFLPSVGIGEQRHTTSHPGQLGIKAGRLTVEV